MFPMTDHSVDDEIKANNRRKEASRDGDDKNVVELLEDTVAPIAQAVEREQDDEESVAQRREGNDADQRAV